MKKRYSILTIVLLLVIVSMSGKTKKPDKVLEDSSKLNLINPISQNVQINCIDLYGRIYFMNDIVLTKSELKSKKLCFFLNKDFLVTEAVIEDVTIPLMQYKKAEPEDFFPTLNDTIYAKINGKCNVYEFTFGNVNALKDTITVRLKYKMKQLGTTRPDIVNKKSVYLRGPEFWYPRNIYKDSEVSLLVKTTDQIIFSLNSKAVVYDREEYLKEYNISFMDYKDQPAYVIFKKSELK